MNITYKLKMRKSVLFLLLITLLHPTWGEINNKPIEQLETVPVNKCCEIYELYVGRYCTHVRETNESLWQPIFMNEHGEADFKIKPRLITGYPDCGSRQKWPVYHYKNSSDTLRLLPNGVLRHYIVHFVPGEEENDEVEIVNGKNIFYYDYEQGKYCMEKRIDDNFVSEFAWVCTIEHITDWTTTDFLMRNVVNPITHGIGIICLLIIAIVYFIMPTLRDLSGNIVTTICMCLILSQTADLIRMLSVFSSHISLLITDSICYISMLAAFFWLNSLGYYIWRTFRSRNVFLRITDGKKYCYYSAYAWTCTIALGVVAIFAHFTMDYPDMKPKSKYNEKQEEIGSLAMIIFFVPVAFTIVMDLFFFATTLKKINRMHTYGRIHHKLRHSFRMFLLLLLIMTTTWLFFLLTFSKFDGLIYCYMIVNALQGPLILYVCVFNQKHVAYLLKKTCCYTDCVCTSCRPEQDLDYGDELTSMAMVPVHRNY